MSWERLTVYTLTCDETPCAGAAGRDKSLPGSEDFLPRQGTGLRGAEHDARHSGWTVRRARRKPPRYSCPACTRKAAAGGS